MKSEYGITRVSLCTFCMSIVVYPYLNVRVSQKGKKGLTFLYERHGA